MANAILAICILGGPIALAIVLLAQGLPRRRWRPARVPRMPAPALPGPAASQRKRPPSREFAVESTVIVQSAMFEALPAPPPPAPAAAVPSRRPTRAQIDAVVPPAASAVVRPPTATETTVAFSRTSVAPPPIPRGRVARGSVVPSTKGRGSRSFVTVDQTLESEPPLMPDDTTAVEDPTGTELPPWLAPPRSHHVR